MRLSIMVLLFLAACAPAATPETAVPTAAVAGMATVPPPSLEPAISPVPATESPPTAVPTDTELPTAIPPTQEPTAAATPAGSHIDDDVTAVDTAAAATTAVVYGRTEEGAYFHGSPTAPVTLVDYSDFL